MLVEIIKGALFSFGFFGSAILMIAILVNKKKQKETFKATDLLVAFEEYLKVQKQSENYELLPELNEIVEALKEGNILSNVDFYEIKGDSSLLIKEKGEGMTIRVIKNYRVIGRKK